MCCSCPVATMILEVNLTVWIGNNIIFNEVRVLSMKKCRFRFPFIGTVWQLTLLRMDTRCTISVFFHHLLPCAGLVAMNFIGYW
jgi:hypothetical protein